MLIPWGWPIGRGIWPTGTKLGPQPVYPLFPSGNKKLGNESQLFGHIRGGPLKQNKTNTSNYAAQECSGGQERPLYNRKPNSESSGRFL